MSEINENEQISSKFYKRLDNPADISFLNNLPSSVAILELVSRQEGRAILAQLVRNIELIDSKYPENYDKRCRDINYWLNEKIETCKSKYKEDISNGVTGVFNDVKLKKKSGEKFCGRNKKPYSSENTKLMKDLDDYCEIRNNFRCYKFENYEQILRYNAYIKLKREQFRSKMNDICPKDDCQWKEYTIDAKCTLNDLDITFRAINCDDLYKEEFTPVGSILHRFRRRKYDLKRNFDRLDHDIYSLYDSDRMPSDSENKRYYIEYARPHN
ncbi:Plasmodium vivax Vir protein, putative [Plasmodium vivax]|uniref:Vir protein, putative n=1 Tax=Plasmodium vivax TaxID=5855 RepID=A0A1G4EF95_PLAVI|nr:Plasmodium vivax Vir protein, putative [Plasmodium vivax]